MSSLKIVKDITIQVTVFGEACIRTIKITLMKQKTILKLFKVKIQQRLIRLQDAYLNQPFESTKTTKRRSQIIKTA